MTDPASHATPRRRPQRQRRPSRNLRQKVYVTLVLSLLLAGLGALLLSCCWVRPPLPKVPLLPPAPQSIVMPPTVKVVIAESAPSFSVTCRGEAAWHATDGDSPVPLDAAPEGPWVLGVADGCLTINGVSLRCTRAEMLPAGALFQLDDRPYRGGLLVKLSTKGGLDALNIVEPEAYLRSVVASEVYPRWPLDALMAQAVTARTYMLYALGGRGYMSRLDMAYKGASAESGPTDLAVDLTRGIILTYRDKVLPAYFHTTCGGHTASASKMFGGSPITPLSGVACEWCRASSTYQWHAEVPLARLNELLAARGIPAARTLEPVETAPDGYARNVLINGETLLNASTFRLIVGGGALKSTHFTVSEQDGVLVFDGHGFGHGVGLCQWGARGLAEAGIGWVQILQYYFPDAELQRVR
jgi:stage II sporulation protein D